MSRAMIRAVTPAVAPMMSPVLLLGATDGVGLAGLVCDAPFGCALPADESPDVGVEDRSEADPPGKTMVRKIPSSELTMVLEPPSDVDDSDMDDSDDSEADEGED